MFTQGDAAAMREIEQIAAEHPQALAVTTAYYLLAVAIRDLKKVGIVDANIVEQVKLIVAQKLPES